MNEIEIWLPIGKALGLFDVSNFGSILNPRTGKVLKARPNRKGYLQVIVSVPGKRGLCLIVHRCVAEAFIGPLPDGMVTNHIDAVKTNCRLDNLEYITPNENMQHAYDNGLKRPPSGESNGRVKITEEDVLSIRNLLARKVTQKRIGEMFGLDQTSISNIKVGKSWGHVK